jgi:Zn-dependent peptidase ImmA (M78 family)
MPSREWLSLPTDIREAIEAHQFEAPVKIRAIAREMELEMKAATLAPGISGEIRPNGVEQGRFVVRINRHDPSRRQRFTAAHELAHYLLHRDHIGSGIEDDVLYRSALSDRREAEANRLAADILMPEELVQEMLGTARTLKVENPVEYLADQFEVSEAAMKIRLGIS